MSIDKMGGEITKLRYTQYYKYLLLYRCKVTILAALMFSV
jgi:hypothetical protein